MNLLRILAAANENQPLQWVRLDRHFAIQASGNDITLARQEDDSAVELVVPAERSGLIRVTLTPEQATRLSDSNLPWLIEPQIGQDVEQLHIARGNKDAEGNLTVFAVDREWLANSLHNLAEKQIRPDRILLEILLNEWRPETWNVVIKPGGGFVRTGEQSALILDRQSSETPPLTLQMALRSPPLPSEILVLQTENAGMADLSLWSQTLGLPVRAATGTDWRQARPGKTIDLAQGRFAPPGKVGHIARRLKLAGVLLTVLVATNILGAGIKTILNSLEKQHLESGIEALIKKTLPANTVILDPVLQMQKHLDHQRNAAGIAGANDFLPWVNRLHAALGPQIAGKATTLGFEAGQWIDLNLTDAELASKVANSLQAAGISAEIQPAEAGKASRIRIKITP